MDILGNYIQEIAKIIKEGGIAILPTDTVYGIVADSTNEKAVKRVYEIKNREDTKPISILVSNLNMIREYTREVSSIEEKIIKKCFPGEITIILPKNDKIPRVVTAGMDTVGVRSPNHKLVLDLIKYLGRPIIATSCNISTEDVINNIDDIVETFGDKVECIVYDGEKFSRGGIYDYTSTR